MIERTGSHLNAAYPSYSNTRDSGRAGGQSVSFETSIGYQNVPEGEEGIPAASRMARGKTKKSGTDGLHDYDKYECQTCENRKYQDGSDDPGVSFKTPSKLSPDKAAAAVRSHENEHVTREQAAAAREDRKVVSQSVTYHTAICPECGSAYISGGTTRTVTKGQEKQAYESDKEELGKYVDQSA